MLGDFTHIRACKPFCEKYLTLPAGAMVLRMFFAGLKPKFHIPLKQAVPLDIIVPYGCWYLHRSITFRIWASTSLRLPSMPMDVWAMASAMYTSPKLMVT